MPQNPIFDAGPPENQKPITCGKCKTFSAMRSIKVPWHGWGFSCATCGAIYGYKYVPERTEKKKGRIKIYRDDPIKEKGETA